MATSGRDIPEYTRQRIAAWLRAGMSVRRTAQRFSVSVPTVMKIKHESKLVGPKEVRRAGNT